MLRTPYSNKINAFGNPWLAALIKLSGAEIQTRVRTAIFTVAT